MALRRSQSAAAVSQSDDRRRQHRGRPVARGCGQAGRHLRFRSNPQVSRAANAATEIAASSPKSVRPKSVRPKSVRPKSVRPKSSPAEVAAIQVAVTEVAIGDIGTAEVAAAHIPAPKSVRPMPRDSGPMKAT